MGIFALGTCKPPSAGWQESTDTKETLETMCLGTITDAEQAKSSSEALCCYPPAHQRDDSPTSEPGDHPSRRCCSSIVACSGKLGNKVISLEIRSCKNLGSGANWLLGRIWHIKVWRTGCSVPGIQERESSKAPISLLKHLGFPQD